MTNVNTVFDGQARDPGITTNEKRENGCVYVYVGVFARKPKLEY